MRIFDKPYAPARAALQSFAAREAGHAAPAGQPFVADILSAVDQLAQSGQPVPASIADALRADVAAAVELVCPLVTGQDADERRANAECRAWVENSFRLALGHLDL